jgi:nucleotide-binding universal stress UspA family protein
VLLRGALRILLLYDVAEALDLRVLHDLLGSRGTPTQPEFSRRTPEYVRFEQVPIVEPIQPLILAGGERLPCSLKYYSYGVVRAQLEVPFECDWDALVPQASRWMNLAPVEPLARQLVRERLAQLGGVLVKPSPDWLQEDYLVIDLQSIRDNEGGAPTAAELLADHAERLVQLIRGETVPLAPRAAEEALQASASYYASDLVVVGSSAALVYDRPEDAAATIQILEYAQTQLLEFRYYDNLMTRVLAEVYGALDRKRNILLSRQSLTRDANRLNTIRLDVMELTEHVDNAIKFLSDIFYARVYRMAAARMGVPDYRALVEQKLRTAGELYDVMVNQFNEARTFVIEVLIALLCLLDVILLLRGR